MRRITDGRVVHPQVVADLANHDETRVHSDADFELFSQRRRPADTLLHRALNAERSQDRPVCMIFAGERRAEERHEAIAEELVDRALVAVDFIEAELKKSFQQTVHRFGAQDFGQRRRVGQVAEEDSDLLALALERVA